MFWVFFPKCPLANGFWVVNILKCHLVLGSKQILNIVSGTFKCTLYSHFVLHWYECLDFPSVLINSVTGVKESFLQRRPSSPATKQPTFNCGNICNKEQEWCENMLHICLLSAFNPSWDRHISTHCQQSHVPTAALRQVLIPGCCLSQLHCCFGLISLFSLPKVIHFIMLPCVNKFILYSFTYYI